jgi:hypothetical protein
MACNYLHLCRYSLQYVYGIGDTTAQKILSEVGIEPTCRTYKLTEDELTSLRDEVEKYTVEGDLRRQIALNIKRCAMCQNILVFQMITCHKLAIYLGMYLCESQYDSHEQCSHHHTGCKRSEIFFVLVDVSL